MLLEKQVDNNGKRHMGMFDGTHVAFFAVVTITNLGSSRHSTNRTGNLL